MSTPLLVSHNHITPVYVCVWIYTPIQSKTCIRIHIYICIYIHEELTVVMLSVVALLRADIRTKNESRHHDRTKHFVRDI